MFFISVTIQGDPFKNIETGFLTMLYLVSVFIAFDLTLVAHVLFRKIKDGADYIAVDNHLYKMTVYTASYVMIGGKKVKQYIDIKKRPKRMFKKMTTCLNPECENYSQELEKKAKVCPSCEARVYLSEVLQNSLTCVNKGCENYGHELKQDIEVCPSCGTEIRPLAFIFNPRLALPAIAAAVLSSILFAFVFIYMYNYVGMNLRESTIVDILNIIRIIILVISVIMGFLSKNVAAFVITLIFCFFAFIVGNEYVYVMSYW
jgi:hypothetical protein